MKHLEYIILYAIGFYFGKGNSIPDGINNVFGEIIIGGYIFEACFITKENSLSKPMIHRK